MHSSQSDVERHCDGDANADHEPCRQCHAPSHSRGDDRFVLTMS